MTRLKLITAGAQAAGAGRSLDYPELPPGADRGMQKWYRDFRDVLERDRKATLEAVSAAAASGDSGGTTEPTPPLKGDPGTNGIDAQSYYGQSWYFVTYNNEFVFFGGHPVTQAV
jgi:hypothetical protein